MDCSVSSLLYDSFYDSIAKEYHLDFPVKNPQKPVLIFGSVDWLICFSISKDFTIWNPSISKFKKFWDSRFGNYILYDFGYDQLHDDYKVLSFYGTYDHDRDNRIYSSKNDSWRIVINDLPPIGLFSKSDGIFVNGKLYWVNSPSSNIYIYIYIIIR